MTLLKEIVTIEKGRKYNLLNEFQQGAIRVFQANDFRNEEKPLYTIDENGVWANPDEVLLVWDGSVGQMGFGKTGYIGSTMVKLTIKNKDKFYPAFIYKLLQTKSEFLKRKSTGATIMHINRKSLENIVVPNLSVKQQIEIAEKLTQAETLIAKRKQSIALLDEYLKSSFLEMFYSSKDTLSWEEVTIEKVAKKIRSGPFGSSLLHDEFIEGGTVRVLGIDNVVDNIFKWKRVRSISEEKFNVLKRYLVYPNDVLVSIMATLGRTAVVPENIPTSINSKHLAAITFNRDLINPYFIAYAFHSHPSIIWQMNSKRKGSIMDGLNTTIIKKVKINLPPITLQNQFAQLVQKTEALKVQYKTSLQELQNMYGALSQKAFKGELVMPKVYAMDEPVLSVAAEPTPTYKKAAKNELSNDEMLQLYFMTINLAKHKGKKEEAYLAEVKMEKSCHLGEYNIPQLKFNRKPVKEKHGPVDFERLNKLLAYAAANDIFYYDKSASFEKYTEGGNFNTYFSKAMLAFRPFMKVVNNLLQVLFPLDTNTIDLYATTFAAWNNLLLLKKPTTVKDIAKEARWHVLKKRFNDDDIKQAIGFLKENDLVPMGVGSIVKDKSR